MRNSIKNISGPNGDLLIFSIKSLFNFFDSNLLIFKCYNTISFMIRNYNINDPFILQNSVLICFSQPEHGISLIENFAFFNGRI